jgi:uncharacterized membrane protein YvbJ
MSQCPNCGSFLEKTAKFCTDCGNPIDISFKNEIGDLLRNLATDLTNPTNDLEYGGIECLKCGS